MMQPVRWGLIGCGDISEKRVAPAMRDLSAKDLAAAKGLPFCELVAVNRSRSELAESFAKKYGARKWYSTWKEILKDEEIDAVYVATPVYLHAEITTAAAERGKHVLCEKPMAMNIAECDKMIEACRKHRVKLGIAYYRHFYSVLSRIKKIVASGEIGQVILSQINAFENFNPEPGDARYWLMEKAKAGGGPMFDFGCHRIEVLLNLFGAVKYAKGFLDTLLYQREVEDTATAFLRFQSGSDAILNISHACMESQDTLNIFGSEGSIHVPVLNAGAMTVKTRGGERAEQHPPHQNIHQPLIEDFNLALIEGREPAVTGKTGREVNRILAAIYQ